MKHGQHQNISGRLFLVGCPRSGTTLLQSLLAAHPEIASFPESHFFPALVEGGRLRRLLRLAAPGVRTRFIEFLEALAHPAPEAACPHPGILMRSWAHAFIRVLDEETCKQTRSIWLEKTPRHLHYVNYIRRYVPDARFIHLVRNGADVVASMYEVTHQYPEAWGGARSIEECIQRWISDLRLTRRYASQPTHMVVRYEQLTEDPTRTLKCLCRFIGVDFELGMLHEHKRIAQEIVLESEPWKAQSSKIIRSSNDTKFYRVFTPEQQQRVIEHVSAYDLDQLCP